MQQSTTQFSDLTGRLDRLESGLEKRISNKVAQILDKRISTEVSRIKKDVDDQISDFKDSIRAEVTADIEDLNEKIDSLRLDSPVSQPDLSRNLIIRNLSETSNERIETNVNTMFRDGLKIRDVSALSAERKVPQEGSRNPGVVIVTMKSADEKKKVMSV